MRQGLRYLLACWALSACTELPASPPDPSERVAGGVSSLVTREGLAYLTARLVAEEEALGEVRFEVPSGHAELGEGGSLVFGPSSAQLAIFDARIEPGEGPSEGGLSLSFGLRGVEMRVVTLHRPPLGAPERCFLRLELGETRVAGTLYPLGEGEHDAIFSLDDVQWWADQELQMTPEADCSAAVAEGLDEVYEASFDSLQAAIHGHLRDLGAAISVATGLGLRLEGSAPVGTLDNQLRFLLAPAEAVVPGDALTVQEAGLLARFDASLDAISSSVACAPSLPEGPLDASPLPEIPTLAPAGEVYRMAMAFDRVWLQRVLGWLGASGRLCRDLRGSVAPTLADLPEVPGIAGLVNVSQHVRLRFRPTGGVSVELQEEGSQPLLLQLPGFSLDVYAQIEGAPVAVVRVTGDIELPLSPVFADEQLGVMLGEASLENLQVDAPLSGLSDEALNELGETMLQAGLESLARSLVVPAPQLPGRSLAWVATEATDTHLLLYLDIR